MNPLLHKPRKLFQVQQQGYNLEPPICLGIHGETAKKTLSEVENGKKAGLFRSFARLVCYWDSWPGGIARLHITRFEPGRKVRLPDLQPETSLSVWTQSRLD
ncbi:hypothetical protein JTE90_026484 [Oedothorax gibbosus]|uniref:Uncharacterized protein n=1 Tax=Oedothorax gibbosus TaxID=931172 RepID=A0AAV6VS20_9ARAC|nr:hypothetical protein JTE90_026484 [Oedothorax gibbosus]